MSEQQPEGAIDNTRQAVENRPDPATMAIAPMREELREVSRKVHEGRLRIDMVDVLEQRGGDLHRELEDRLAIAYPECPNCGEWDLTDWGQESGQPLLCWSCERAPPEPIRAEVHRQWRRIREGSA